MKRLLNSEPVLFANLLKAILVVAVAWGMPITGDQTAALVGIVLPVMALIGFGTRAVVTPVAKVNHLAKELGGNATKLADKLTGEGEPT